VSSSNVLVRAVVVLLVVVAQAQAAEAVAEP